jgi:serine/threonine protein kinase
MVSSRSSKDPYLGRVIAGRYRLEARLGEGGMGVVYRSRHVLIDRVVAIKLIRPDLRGETHLRAWMLREARAANRVDHAHIVDIHDVGETEDGELYLVMEYLVGTPLAAECSKGPMTMTRAVDILEQMCAALARAHDLGVVHRDLKSDNIMLTVRGGRRDFVKILDFGLAGLARESRLAPKGAVFGTPEYMSPEQARGEDATALSDLYALGILFYEMITGQLPFRSGDRDKLLELQRSGSTVRPRELRPEVPETAENIIMKLLEKDPKKRFRDGHHLQEELKALQRALPSTPWEAQQTDTPVAPPPPPPAQSPGVVEWSRRAAQFSRMVARVYPNGRAPSEIQQAVDRMWELAARATRLEGEIASHSRKLDEIERRGRAFRAELGRRVEDLAQEESRTLREASGERERLKAIVSTLPEVERRADTARNAAQGAEKQGGNITQLRKIFEEAGMALAQVDATRRMQQDSEQRAQQREVIAKNLRRQIEELRAQLQRYGEAWEADLSVGRETIAARVREALAYEKAFGEASAMLMQHVQGRPECRDLLKEITLREQEQRESGHVPAAPSTRSAQTSA